MVSFPEAFEASMRTRLGEEFTAFAQSMEVLPPVSVRLHPLKKCSLQAEAPVPWSTQGKYLATRPSFTLDPLFHAGSYYVQEASSMFLEHAIRQTVDLDQPVRVLDLCAAPGGKSTLLQTLLHRDSLLVSNETIRTRASILSENIQKWGYPNAIVTNNDPADFTNLRGFFDVIVIDAPCSGEGLFRKDPGASRAWSPDNVELCASRQRRIVSAVWEALREGGILIYSTCTFNTRENEENLRWMRTHHEPEFLKLSPDPSWGITEVSDGSVVGYRFYPHKVGGEGFFLAAIRKTEPISTLKIKTKKRVAAPSARIQERLCDWVKNADDNRFFQFNDLAFYTRTSVAHDFTFLLQYLKVVYAGTNAATIKHEKLIPEHALALSVELNRSNVQTLEVNEETARRYLRKDPLALTASDNGFTLLSFQDTPLGWVNVLPGRVNNLYPSAWRIRMAADGNLF